MMTLIQLTIAILLAVASIATAAPPDANPRASASTSQGQRTG